MRERLSGSFNAYRLIPVFHDEKMGWWCLDDKTVFADLTQSDLDIAVTNTMIGYESRGVIVIHTAFTSEIRKFISYVNCDEYALIEILKKGLLKELV